MLTALLFRRILLLTLVIGTIASSQAQTVLLDDFQTMRTNGYGEPLWYPYYNNSQVGSIASFEGDNRLKVYVGQDGVAGNNGEVVGLYLLYWPLQPGRFPFPSGFTRGNIKSGTWNPMTNRMEFWLKCSTSKSRPEQQETIHVGTYVKPQNAGSNDQGQHYYHYFHPNIYPNRWVKMEMNWAPSYRVSSDPNTNYPPDVEWVNPTGGAPVHYFDGLTSWYISMGGAGSAPYTCYLDDFKMFAETGEPDDSVKSLAVTYNGSAYEVSWDTLKNRSLDFEMRYSTSSMKANGFTSGTSGGTKQKPDTGGYAGVRWTSPAMPEAANGMYFAIKPAGDSRFAEIYFPRTPGGSAGPVLSQCDVNNDGRTDSADVQAANDAALGKRGCENDLDGNGKCDVVDSQRVINAALGGACRVGTT